MRSFAVVAASFAALAAAAPTVSPGADYAIQIKYKGLIKPNWDGRFLQLVTDNEKGFNYATVDIPNNQGSGEIQTDFSQDHHQYLVYRHGVLVAGWQHDSGHAYRSPLVFAPANLDGVTTETGLGWTFDNKMTLNGDSGKWYVCEKGDGGNLSINYGKSWTVINPDCKGVDILRVYRN